MYHVLMAQLFIEQLLEHELVDADKFQKAPNHEMKVGFYFGKYCHNLLEIWVQEQAVHEI